MRWNRNTSILSRFTVFQKIALLLGVCVLWIYLSPSFFSIPSFEPETPTFTKPAKKPTTHGTFVLPKPQKSEQTDLEFPCEDIRLPTISELNTTVPVKPATIVYSLAVHHRWDMLQLWFDRMWEPQHFYVIHIDSKAQQDFFEQVSKFAAEKSNVVINPDRYYTIYYGWSVLWNHISNFMYAIKLGQSKDYWINSDGMSFPIKTPNEINYFLGEHLGMSFMQEHCVIGELQQVWVNWTWTEVKNGVIVANKDMRIKPFLPLRFARHPVILHRSVVDWMLTDPHALHLLYWLRNTKTPDEVFYATILNASPFKEKLWNRNNFVYTTSICCTKFVRQNQNPCVLGLCNFPDLFDTNHLFINRVDSEIDPNLVPQLIKELDKRIEREKLTQTTNRIPLHTTQTLDPDFILLS